MRLPARVLVPAVLYGGAVAGTPVHWNVRVALAVTILSIAYSYVVFRRQGARR